MKGIWKVEVKERTMSVVAMSFWPRMANTPLDICLQTDRETQAMKVL